MSKQIENLKPLMPLSEEKVREIRKLKKGKRPDPKTYLNREYVEEHIRKFNDEASIFVSIKNYDKFIKDGTKIGYEDDTQYVTRKDVADMIEEEANGDASKFCERIGWDDVEELRKGGYVVRIDVKNIGRLHPRIPSGNEMGTNKLYVPGGYTAGEIPEIVVDRIPKTSEYVTSIRIIKVK